MMKLLSIIIALSFVTIINCQIEGSYITGCNSEGAYSGVIRSLTLNADGSFMAMTNAYFPSPQGTQECDAIAWRKRTTGTWTYDNTTGLLTFTSTLREYMAGIGGGYLDALFNASQCDGSKYALNQWVAEDQAAPCFAFEGGEDCDVFYDHVYSTGPLTLGNRDYNTPFSCNDTGDAGDFSYNVQDSVMPMDGVYATAQCADTGHEEQGNKIYFQAFNKIEGDKNTEVFITFLDPNCDPATVLGAIETVSLDYIVSSKDPSTNASWVEHVVQSQRVNPLNDIYTYALAQNCSQLAPNLKTGDYIDVTNEYCPYAGVAPVSQCPTKYATELVMDGTFQGSIADPTTGYCIGGSNRAAFISPLPSILNSTIADIPALPPPVVIPTTATATATDGSTTGTTGATSAVTTGGGPTSAGTTGGVTSATTVATTATTGAKTTTAGATTATTSAKPTTGSTTAKADGASLYFSFVTFVLVIIALIL